MRRNEVALLRTVDTQKSIWKPLGERRKNRIGHLLTTGGVFSWSTMGSTVVASDLFFFFTILHPKEICRVRSLSRIQDFFFFLDCVPYYNNLLYNDNGRDN